MRHLVFAALGTVFLAAPAHATNEDTQLWVSLTASTPLADGLTGTIEISPRAREGADQLLTRGSLDLRVADGLSLGAGMTYVEFAGGNEFRPHQQIAYSTGPLALRTRLEERFFEDADRPQIRLRQQVRLSFPLGRRTQISGMGEVLYALQNQTRGTADGVDQWRAEVAVRRKLSDKLDATVAYRAILAPRGSREDQLSHVPVVTLAWKL